MLKIAIISKLTNNLHFVCNIQCDVPDSSFEHVFFLGIEPLTLELAPWSTSYPKDNMELTHIIEPWINCGLFFSYDVTKAMVGGGHHIIGKYNTLQKFNELRMPFHIHFSINHYK